MTAPLPPTERARRRLERAQERYVAAKAERDAAAIEAKATGLPWSALSDIIGTTRQNVQQRWGRPR